MRIRTEVFHLLFLRLICKTLFSVVNYDYEVNLHIIWILVLSNSHRQNQNGFQRSWLILIPFLALNEKKNHGREGE